MIGQIRTRKCNKTQRAHKLARLICAWSAHLHTGPRRPTAAPDLRASPPAAQARTWPRPLRRPILAWPAPPRAHDDDRLRLPAKPPPRRGERGEKESPKDRPSRHCPRSGAPSSPFSPARRPIDVPIAGEPSEDTSNKSAKVVLRARSARRGRVQIADKGGRPGVRLGTKKMTERGIPRPGKRLAALRTRIKNGEIDHTVQFARWLVDRADRSETSQLVRWIERSRPRDLAEQKPSRRTSHPRARRLAHVSAALQPRPQSHRNGLR